ncbi:Xylosyltransferase, family GT14 [Chondrus crispus]|uniref:Xylosyltransferase, family GT14 n=1 Tax=Chondrus crispus TaxID=2769 RepID=R7QQ19_CHOCR|nr:Xylosyltransferase, family GT14 [Chondrus crispus]CDF40214.1 Xylosyltransferase, family GT14 [Chondrus crispus]|eukprot:XP_005710508.1 Xylosyltransferase, family GT14 [Chondrus crispus]
MFFLPVMLFLFLAPLGKTLRGSASRSENRANLAFFVQVSNTSVLNFPRLLRAIWHERNIYVIHFDMKIGSVQRKQILRLLKEDDASRFANVIVMDSEAISYAGISMLLNTINGLSALLRASTTWDYFINISGSDYPLVSANTLRQLLGSAPVLSSQLNFLQTQAADKNMDWFFNRRMSQVQIDTALWERGEDASATIADADSFEQDWALVGVNASHPVSRNRVPFVKTEGWVILHRSFCDFAVNSPAARRLLLSFATARAADELFFGTLLMSSGNFRDTVAWDGLRYILWGMDGKRWSRPAYLDQIGEPERLRDLITTSGALFARKFAVPESKLADYIDAEVSGVGQDHEVNRTAVHEYAERARRRLQCVVEKRDNILLRGSADSSSRRFSSK